MKMRAGAPAGDAVTPAGRSSCGHSQKARGAESPYAQVRRQSSSRTRT
jgi:hypothetical protein